MPLSSLVLPILMPSGTIHTGTWNPWDEPVTPR
ncbi:hypothetical protein STAFG_8639 [Streptomyces afghaniensis 772]|uniref:Uncharacterized protein n=1 Tax=Streptomyces afghaniensis 772 TaxID=1283301 RepID=S4M565_9ACTN|nr:hypothetical protein STAFG_8639 [Streptomyces afghaniensis 772]